MVSKKFQSERGVVSAEYALIVGCLSFAIVTVLPLVTNGASSAFNKAGVALHGDNIQLVMSMGGNRPFGVPGGGGGETGLGVTSEDGGTTGTYEGDDVNNTGAPGEIVGPLGTGNELNK